MLVCDNIPSSPFLKAESGNALDGCNSLGFLSFQDALHYLIRALDLRGKTILLPAFYCDATLNDMKKHGLQVVLCPVDYGRLDVDPVVFRQCLGRYRPDIVLIYDMFGIPSRLYERDDWLALLKPEAVIIGDCAHSLLACRPLRFLSDRHFFIDSARKTTACMMAHLVAPPAYVFRQALVDRGSPFRLFVRLVYWMKTVCLSLAMRFGLERLGRLGIAFYYCHDHYIGSRKPAYGAFSWDERQYRRIDFSKIRARRMVLYDDYCRLFSPLAQQGHIVLYDLSDEARREACFFFFRMPRGDLVLDLLDYFQSRGFWIDQLWDFDAIDGMDENERAQAKSVVVFPYTIHTNAVHIASMAALLKAFFNEKHPF